MRSTVRALSIIVLALGCGDPDPAADGGRDSGPTTCETVPEPLASGDPDGHAEPLGASATEARAGRIEASEIPADRTGLALIAPGDFVLANDRVAIVIEDAGDSDIYDRFGGRPIGVGRVEGGALVDAADFGEVLFGLGGFLVATESVGVVADGSDGGAAIVRVTGPLAGIDFLGELLPIPLRGAFEGYPAALEYRLEPGAEQVQVTLIVDHVEPGTARVPLLLIAFVQSYRMPIWTEAGGFESIGSGAPWVAFDDPVQSGYAWVAPTGSALRGLFDETGIALLDLRAPPLPGCQRVEQPLGSIAIGHGLNGAQAVAWRDGGTALSTIEGTVVESDGTPATDVRVHVTSGDAHVTRALVDATGSFSLAVPGSLPGGAPQLWAYRRGVAPVGPIAIAATGPTEITLPASGFVEVHAVDEGGAPLPVRAQVMGEVARPPATWGEVSVSGGRLQVEFAGADGIARMRVPVGSHRVVVSRGFEYELVDRTVDVAAGETTVVDATLVRSVDTTDTLCADYHVHTHRSPDSGDDARFKVVGLVADGVELPVRSDHEFVAAFDPVVQELGLDAFAQGLSGEELTTFSWGHFGVFPLEPDPSAANGGAPRWPGRLAPDVFDEVRARPGAPALIINHPRSGGSFGGYFTATQYDPDTGTVGRMDLWDDEFTLVEVFNDSGLEENRDGTVRDWFSLLRGGRRVFAVGSSDSHNLLSAPVGYPRTCLALGTDDPRAVTPTQVRDATAGGHSYVSGGVQLEVLAGTVGPGGEATGVGERASIDVVVRAATWIDVDELEVIVDGVTTETIAITAADADPTDATIRFRQTIEAPVASAGSWVVIHASGGDALEPVHPGRLPFAVSNPISLRR